MNFGTKVLILLLYNNLQLVNFQVVGVVEVKLNFEFIFYVK